MAKTCVTEKTAQRQAWIENGLLELMQQRKFDDITVTDLCCHLALSRRSFYRYFQDLEDVLNSLLDHTFQSMGLMDLPANIAGFQKNMEFWLAHRALLDALNRSNMLDKLFEFTRRHTANLSIQAYLAGDGLDMDICREASLFTTSGSVSLIIAWYADGFQKTPEQMARIAHRLLFQPILHRM